MRRVAPAWTLGLLAGGKSRRMGCDKATIPIGGQSLLQHQAHRLAPPGVPVIVGTGPGGPGRDAGFPCKLDPLPGAGPLAGLAALLQDLETPYLLAVPCDVPLLPPDLGDRLLEKACGVDAVLVTVGGVLQPLPALLSGELLPLLLKLLDSGARKASAYVDRAPCALVPFESLYPALSAEEALLNVNDPESLVRARDLLEASGAR